MFEGGPSQIKMHFINRHPQRLEGGNIPQSIRTGDLSVFSELFHQIFSIDIAIIIL
jgi:hypothetical protein